MFFARESGNLLNYYTLKLWDFVVEKCVSRKWSAVRAQILRATVPWLYQLVSTCLSKSISFSLSLSLPFPFSLFMSFVSWQHLLFCFSHFPTSLCGVLVFDSVSRSSASASAASAFAASAASAASASTASASSPQHCHIPSFNANFVTHHIFTQLCHTLSFTHNCHTIFVTTFVTHHFVTHLFFTQLCHNFVQLVELNRRLHCAI